MKMDLQEFSNGTYVAANYPEWGNAKLFRRLEALKNIIIKKWGAVSDFTEPPYSPHTTLMYSKTPLGREINTEFFPTSVVINPIKIITLPYYEGSCAALEIECKRFFDINQKLRQEYSLTPTFERFLCHITLLVSETKGIETGREIKLDSRFKIAIPCKVEYEISPLDEE